MPALLVVDETITNPELFEEYKRGVVPTIEKFGGRFLARGPELEVLEASGRWEPGDNRVSGHGSVERLVSQCRVRAAPGTPPWVGVIDIDCHGDKPDGSKDLNGGPVRLADVQSFAFCRSVRMIAPRREWTRLGSMPSGIAVAGV